MNVKRGLFFSTLILAVALAACTEQAAEEVAEQAPVPVRVVSASKGTIQATLSFSGEIKPSSQVDILPFSSGHLKAVFMEEGAAVKAGEPLAQLETDMLEAQIRQAEANVQSAQARLVTILQGARPEEIAIAEAQLAMQRSRLRALMGSSKSVGSSHASIEAAEAALVNAQARLDQLLNPAENDIAVAHAVMEASTSNETRAEAVLRQLRNPSERDVLAAEASISAAEAAIDSAQARLADLLDGPSAADIARLEAAIAAAEVVVRRAETVWASYRTPLNDAKIARLLDAYDVLNNARDRLARDREQDAPEAVRRAAEDAVQHAYRKVLLAEDDLNSFDAGVSTEEIQAARAANASARAGLDSAQANLKKLIDGPTEAEIEAAKAAAEAAEANLTTAQVHLARLKDPRAADIHTAQAAIDTAKSQHAIAQQQLDNLMHPSAAERTAAEAARDAAASAVARAEAELQAQQAAIAQASQQLSLTTNKFTDADIAGAAAAVAQAVAAVDLTRIHLENATLTAPFDAVISKKHLSAGAMVAPQTPLYTLISQDKEVVFNTEEGALGLLSVGLPVTLTVATFPDRRFDATITTIAPVADPASRTFQIKAVPAAGQEGLRAGMFANVLVATDSREDTLLLPFSALIQRGEETYVFVINNGQAEERKVEVGLRNYSHIQIISGVAEGDQVAVQGNQTLRAGDRVAIIP